MTDIVISIVAAVLGGLFFRFRGMTTFLPRIVWQALYALPYAFAVYHYEPIIGNIWLMTGLVFVFTLLMIKRGHGRQIDMGTNVNADYEPEWYEPVLKPLWGMKNETLYDFIAMCVSGLTYSLVAGIVSGNIWVALSGLTKGPAYYIGHKIPVKIKHFEQGAEIGEFLTGVFQWGALCLIYFLLG